MTSVVPLPCPVVAALAAEGKPPMVLLYPSHNHKCFPQTSTSSSKFSSAP
jgi:hypothetical protein